MRRRVHLCGPFKAYHDGPIEIEATSVWEAVDAVTRQVRGFTPDPIKGRQRIQVPGFKSFDEMKAPSDVEDIYILPAMTFGKNSGLVQTIIGVTLMVASFLIPGGWTAPWNQAMFWSGLSMTIGGVMQMLTPQPKNSPENQSKYIAVNQNTVAIGTPIPLLYGRRRIGGHILSLQVVAKAQPTS
jgi:predicted phage tail protein